MDRPSAQGIVRPLLFNGSLKDTSHCLGIVSFGDRLALSAPPDQPPTLALPMASTKTDEFSEAWISKADGQVHFGQRDGIAFGANDEYLFCVGIIPPSETYGPAAESIYDGLFKLTGDLKYPTLFRLWNYIGGILTEEPSGLKIYQDFVRGRAKAFGKRASGSYHMPAATGIGTRGEGIGIVALAARSAEAVHVENPLQVPAYNYPSAYGPSSPSFARATALRSSSNEAEHPALSVFVSGTASIVGHESVFIGDIENQTKTTLNNISTLISRENLSRFSVGAGYTLHDVEQMKIYVKHEEDMDAVRHLVNQQIGDKTLTSYFNVDVCRDELLVEIEAVLPTRVEEV